MARGHLRWRGQRDKRGKPVPGHGSWAIVLSLGVDPATGRRRQRWVTVRGTRQDAEAKLAELLTEARDGGLQSPARMTVGEYLAYWQRTYVEPRLRPVTRDGYARLLRDHLIPALGPLPLAKLTPLHIEDYYARKAREGLAQSTLAYHHGVLHRALAHAVRWRLLRSSPADLVEPPRRPRTRGKAIPLRTLQAFLDTLTGTRNGALFTLDACTGLRRGELLGLRWGDVNLRAGSVRVVQQVVLLAGGALLVQATKTEAGQRTVPMPREAVDALRRWREQEEARCEAARVPFSLERFVFCRVDGSPLSPSAVTEAFRYARRKAGLDGVRLHDLRHSYVSPSCGRGWTSRRPRASLGTPPPPRR